MKVSEFDRIDLKLYYDKLDNGLEVYIVPKQNVNNIYVTFTTKFGSKHLEFIPAGGKKKIKVPEGVAHFLEHKIFEQEDGKDPFAFFSERGADINASTSNHKTTYHFSSPNNFEENLEFLLDLVQSPYFTNQNVEKEKGIIEQEIKMYQDKPNYVLYEKTLYNCIVKHPIRIPIAGTIDSINKITKEDLYKCYNTFYHPSNMFIVVTGNVEPNHVLEIIKKNQEKKKFPKQTEKIKIREYNEPDKVYKEKEIIHMNVGIPKLANAYKFNITNFKDFSKRTIIDFFMLYFDIKVGNTSKLNEALKQEQIINENLDYALVKLETHIIMIIFANTTCPEKLVEKLRSEISNFDIDETEFNRKKKRFISSYIYLSDNIYRINGKIISNIINEGKVITNDYEEIQNLKFEDLKSFFKNISFENNNYVIINPPK